MNKPQKIGGRRLEKVPGKSYTDAQYDVALLMMNTYDDCAQRALASRLRPEEVAEANQFAKDFGGLSSQRTKRTENVEDNPPDEAPEVEGKRTRIWLNLATLVIDEQFDPAAYIRAQFEMWPPGKLMRKQLPLPEGFHGPQAIENYKAARQRLSQEIAVAFKMQQSTFRVQVSRHRTWIATDEEAWATVLASDADEITLSALFRYCLALSISRSAKTKERGRFTAIADAFLDAAALQYVYAADDYDAVFKQWIPENFRRTAQHVYRRLHGVKDAGDRHEDSEFTE